MPSTQDGQGFRRKEKRDAASRARGTANESETFQGKDHLMHGGCGNLEIVLEISLCRRPAIELRVSVEESQVLTLDGGKSRRWRCAILGHANCFTAGISAKEPSRESKVSGGIERVGTVGVAGEAERWRGG